ncbi:MAG: hypothetical protein COZ29_02085 [Candidatus Moranbacteria bacterium CG_4_10_14_3_um_filter_45_9]|nr:MAG: hypothetical protein AUK19_01525 [Candidatus Moranbacteria bacterium CG2_30_45_14]PIX90032.1 MAG: hypothetical protein COZ29_02085 [Candidatus Moranbacteria bacterium CG_4_10_14_3_um_filter_45_9]PJA85225.1 MAG: hypothetical protein CO143_02315 [Candidatus Moranbacteria bacterium CG_4_9_14_3_um_filter_45_14]
MIFFSIQTFYHKQPSREPFVHPAVNFSYEVFSIRRCDGTVLEKNFNSPRKILVKNAFLQKI